MTEAFKRRIVLPSAGPLAETDHVVGHELVHAFQSDLAAGAGGTRRGLSLPLWFVEEMAEYFSLGPIDPHTAMWVRDALRQEKLPGLKELSSPEYFPYRWGQALFEPAHSSSRMRERAGRSISAGIIGITSETGDFGVSARILDSRPSTGISRRRGRAVIGPH